MEKEEKIVKEISKEENTVVQDDEDIEDEQSIAIEKTISKRQQKKEKQRIAWEAKLPEMRKQKRIRQKQRRQERNKLINERLEKGETVDMEEILRKKQIAKLKGKKFKEEFRKKLETSTPIIIDCDFEDNHSAKDLRSLVNQFSYILGANKRFEKPFKIYLAGLKKDKLMVGSWKRKKSHLLKFLKIGQKKISSI